VRQSRFLSLAFTLLCGCAPTERFMLPHGFEGPVAVVFGDTAGASSKDYIFEVPGSGKLFVQEDMPERATIQVYWVERSGNKSKLPPASGSQHGFFGFLNQQASGCSHENVFHSVAFFVGRPVDHPNWQVVRDRHLLATQVESMVHQGRTRDAECVADWIVHDDRTLPPEHREPP
jgi:hypothetical protein